MDNGLTPQIALAFFAFAMAILSVWVKRSPWIWGSFLILAYSLSYLSKLIEPIALAPIGALLVLHVFLKGGVKGLPRFILVLLTTAVSLGLLTHFFPGFHNLNILDQVKLSPDAAPMNLYLNLDKPMIGFFILALGFPLLANPQAAKSLLKIALPMTLLGIGILATLALYSGLIKWELKLPPIFWFFAPINLIFVTIMEEAFWRGFIQKEFFNWFGGKGYLANSGCVIITALLFAALHYPWVPSIPFLSLVFVAGIIYGSIYQYTQALEASIFCHWVFNLTHFLLFTYPVLQSALA